MRDAPHSSRAADARVLQVVLSLNPGGTERLLIELVHRLQTAIPMAVCCLDEPGAWAVELERSGVHVTALRRRPGFHPMLGRALAREAARHGATVIHAHHYSPFIYAALARLWGSGCPVVFTEHGRLSDAPPSVKRRLANTLFARTGARAFAVSEDVRRHLVAEGFDDSRVAVIYNGTDPGPPPEAAGRLRVRTALGVGDETVVVGTVARLDPVKDLATLLRAIAAPSCRQILLLILGDGPERPHLEALAAELHLGSRVRFLGYRADAREWLAGCDIYANSSVSEGVSLTILEAMAAALPVVATAVGGTPEVVDESCGRLVPARNPDALGRTLDDLARHHDRRLELGRAARRRVEARFTIERMVAEYRAVYEAATMAGRA
jgi:glycosyltransferase involved in cell wall biosynthesis